MLANQSKQIKKWLEKTRDTPLEVPQEIARGDQSAARRAISQRLPETAAAAVLEFCDAALAVSPFRVGKPLVGCHGARRGTCRIVYRIDEAVPRRPCARH